MGYNEIMKKILSLILTFVILCSNIFTYAFADEPLKGSVTENDAYKQMESDLFTSKVESLDRKDIIDMTVSQVLDSSVLLSEG